MSPTCPRKVKQHNDTGCWKCGKDCHIKKNIQITLKPPQPLGTTRKITNSQLCDTIQVSSLRNTENGLLLWGFINGKSCDMKYRRTDKVQDHLQQVWEVKIKNFNLDRRENCQHSLLPRAAFLPSHQKTMEEQI
ncbi:hypothetical protein LAZ67_X000889 [Cordylochernes scorpioides]|uniref:Uncharacterized protein n=1 Tax=Cordylochernes scorpioides TaxID=51811 RepID=A0ABY6LS87_9ARAC|nr:hypothetical protein LAZ67_X000889 [Cordylochernes scorpioides]